MTNHRLLFYSIIAVLAINIFSSCKDVEIPGGSNSAYNNVYMPAAINTPDSVTIKMADSTQTIVYGAYFGGYDSPSHDINVQFAVAPELVSTFNLKNGTNYPILPDGSYTLSQTSGVIPKGKLSTEPYKISINPVAAKLTLFQNYLLPVTISKIDDNVTVNESMRTTYYVVKPSLSFFDFPEYDRSAWTINSFSTQEPAEGPTNGGVASSVLDGKLTTFWHSQWAGSTPPPPHWLVVDMGTAKTIHGIAFTGRQSDNTGKPQTVTVSVSNDASNWENVGSLTLKNINAKQLYFVTTFKEGRYFKITVLTTFGNSAYTHLAELGAF